MKKVSIIVPVYKVYDYLDKCLDSLVNQTLDDIEIIVVNDGSPDNSQEIVDEYVKKYPKKVFSYIKENGGLSSARNYGIKKAKGEYLAFVDSDDYVEYDMFERMYAKAHDTKADVVCCQIVYRYNLYAEKKEFQHLDYFGKSISEEPRLLMEAKSYAWNKIYKKELWDNFVFPNQYFEDSAVVYNVLYNANKIEAVNLPLYNYIKERPGSITSEVSPKTYDIFKSCDSILRFYRKQSDYDKLEPFVEEVCIRHLRIRLLYLYNTKEIRFSWKFYNTIKKYLKENIPNYRKNYCMQYDRHNNDPMYNMKIRVLRVPGFFKLVTIMPLGLLKKLKAFIKLPFSLFKRYINNHSEKGLDQKRAFIQKNGLSVLEETLNTLNDIPDVKAFADFGTLLGLIRENGLLKHDLDVDTAVLGREKLYRLVTLILERKGYRLWREYIYNGKVVEQSYHYKDIKVDINYYEYRNKGVNTWLFYREPKKKYRNNMRNIVRMDYSLIDKIKYIDINGNKLAIPTNAEQILVEKYGEKWRTPDKGWIYWQAPAATKLEETGYFILYKYPNY